MLTTTSTHYLHLRYKPTLGDDAPIIRAYEKVIDRNGYDYPDTSNVKDSYRFSQEDCDWIINNLGKEGETIKDFYLGRYDGHYSDLWFYSVNEQKYRALPPKAIEWIKALGVYKINDYTLFQPNK